MPDQLIASRYRILRELGRGGMGVVYVVEHVHTGDQLALKLLYGQSAINAQAVERFKREARASARIKSEHVVKVIDADVAPELDGAPFLVMELLHGSDLQKELESHGALPAEQALHYLGQAARALDKSHQMGIVHRDLKPENLFIHHREDGTTILKILDFGISKIISDGTADMTGAGMTSTGAVMGTPLYMSPEQARGRVAEIGPTTDVWAMGLICLQLLSGEVYWRANTIPELMVQILSEPLYPPSQRWTWMPAPVDAWFARSCAREPGARFPTVGQQIEALRAALGAHPVVPSSPAAGRATGATPLLAARTTSATSSGPRSAARGHAALAVLGGVLVVVAAGAAVGWTVLARRATGSASPPHATSDTAAVRSAAASGGAAVIAVDPPPPATGNPTGAAAAPDGGAPAEPPAVATTTHDGRPRQGGAPAGPAPHSPATAPSPPPAAPHTFNPAAP